jgi:hypothetical protein
MSNVKANPPRVVPPIATGVADDSVPSKSSGRPTFDSRGNAVWEWKTETGKFSVDVSTQRLKKLSASELTIADTARVKKPKGLSLQDDAMPGGGFNPYDRGTPSAGKKAAAPLPPHKPAVEALRKPVKDLKRLQEWMEMKKRLANKKDD